MRSEASRLLTQDEAAAALSISRQTLWRWRKDGTISAVYVGKRIHIPSAEVERILAGVPA